MSARLSKGLLVCAVALFATLVAFGNITDYAINFQFVHHVFLMDTFPGSTITWRAIRTPWLHHAGYLAIIAIETLTAILCWLGGARLLRARQLPAAVFNRAKGLAIAGLTLGFLNWQVGFMSIGGEWFGMWMSSQWNGVPDAFRFIVVILLTLIYVIQRDEERDA